MKEKMIKEMKLREKFRGKIEGLIEIIADRKGWDFYKILNLDVILYEDGKFALAYVTVNYRDENGIDEQLVTTFNKITQKDFLENAKIY